MSRIYPIVAPLTRIAIHTLPATIAGFSCGFRWPKPLSVKPVQLTQQPEPTSNAKFIFGPECLAPEFDRAAARIRPRLRRLRAAGIRHRGALSEDPEMLAAYRSGDCYLAFAKQAGAVPADATKKSHPAERELFKLCALGSPVWNGSQITGCADWQAGNRGS